MSEWSSGRGAREVAALEGLSFSADAGEFVSVIGPSGSGKTTLLRIIGNLLEPTSGSATIEGMSARQARLAGTFSYVFQNPVLLPWRTVLGNVRLPNEILDRQARDPMEPSSAFSPAPPAPSCWRSSSFTRGPRRTPSTPMPWRSSRRR